MEKQTAILNVADIHPSLSQFRRIKRETADYVALLDSVSKHGILQPISVKVREQGGYELMDGANRLSVCKDLGLTTVPALIEPTDADSLILQLQANAVRVKVDNMEYAARLLKIMREKDLTMRELSGIVNKSPAWLSQILALNNLCSEAKDAVRRGEIAIAAAAELAKMPNSMQKQLLKLAVDLPAKDFVKFARRQIKEVKEKLVKRRESRTLEGTFDRGAYLRTWSELEREVDTNSNAGVVLTALGAETPLDGWRACLAWLLHFDPVSLKERDQRHNQLKRRVVSLKEARERSRRIYENLLEKKDD